MQSYAVSFSIRTIVRRRFEGNQLVAAQSAPEAVLFIQKIYGPRLLEILGIIEADQAFPRGSASRSSL